jgi:hypothetical protein
MAKSVYTYENEGMKLEASVKKSINIKQILSESIESLYDKRRYRQLVGRNRSTESAQVQNNFAMIMPFKQLGLSCSCMDAESPAVSPRISSGWV